MKAVMLLEPPRPAALNNTVNWQNRKVLWSLKLRWKCPSVVVSKNTPRQTATHATTSLYRYLIKHNLKPTNTYLIRAEIEVRTQSGLQQIVERRQTDWPKEHREKRLIYQMFQKQTCTKLCVWYTLETNVLKQSWKNFMKFYGSIDDLAVSPPLSCCCSVINAAGETNVRHCTRLCNFLKQTSRHSRSLLLWLVSCVTVRKEQEFELLSLALFSFLTQPVLSPLMLTREWHTTNVFQERGNENAHPLPHI